MSYLSQPTSKVDYGVVKIGNFINVSEEGVISSPELVEGSGITIEYSTSTDFITISAQGADLINVYGTTVSYTATEDDEYIGVSSTSPVTISLPLMPTEGRVYIIKDEFGQGSGKITIQPPLGTLIDKKSNYIISVPNQSVQIVYRAAGWWII
jgi:hypothetical protein